MSDERRIRSELGESAFRGVGGRVPKVVLHGGASHRSLALGPSHLYVSDQESGEVFRIGKGGGVPLVIAQLHRPAAITLSEGYVYGIAHDPDIQYDRGNGKVVRFPLEGGEIEVLATRLVAPEGIVVSGDHVVVTCGGPFDYHDREAPKGTVELLTVSDRRVRTLATKQRRPVAAAFVDDELYWVNMGMKHPTYFRDGALLRVALGDETKKRWSVRKNLSMPGSILVDDEHIYWATSSSYSNPSPGVLYKRPRKGGPAIPLSRSYEGEGCLLAQDKDYIYRMGACRGTLARVPKIGGHTEELLVCDETLALCEGIVVDDERIYWAVLDARVLGGAVWSMPKERTRAPAPQEKVTN